MKTEGDIEKQTETSNQKRRKQDCAQNIQHIEQIDLTQLECSGNFDQIGGQIGEHNIDLESFGEEDERTRH